MKPVRVLHVVGAMNRGGVETWLMHVLRHIDRQAFQMDFLVHTGQPAVYDSEILALGSRILRCPHTRNTARYARQFLRIARGEPYDVLHSHVHHYSGLVLTLGRIARIPVRIAHSHNDTSSLDLQAGLARRSYLSASRRLIAGNCTHGLAVSQSAAASLFGDAWKQDSRYQVLYCGIAPPPDTPVDPAAVRGEFGFSGDDLVIGHVGRFTSQKNHAFLLEIAAAAGKIDPRAKFLLVGDGPLRPEIEFRSRALGLQSRIAFAGLRPDVPRLMRGGMDAMLLPSVHEGLPLVLLEAQAAGLASVVSEGITEEAVVHPTLVRKLALSVSPMAWAGLVLQTAKEPRLDSRLALEFFKSSPFDISRAAGKLCRVYLEHPGNPRSIWNAIMAPEGRNRG